MLLKDDIYLLINHLDRVFLVIEIPRSFVGLKRSLHILTSLAIGNNLTDRLIFIGPARVLR